MRSVIYSVAMSLDGYIAGPDGEFDWIVMDPDIDFTELTDRFDTILIGRRSWQAMQGQGGPGMKGVSTYVFSNTLEDSDCPDAVVSDSPGDVIESIKAADGKDIWLFGGGGLFRSCLDAGLVDRVEVAVIPVLLGRGIPMLPVGNSSHKLTLTGHQVYPKTGTVTLHYERA